MRYILTFACAACLLVLAGEVHVKDQEVARLKAANKALSESRADTPLPEIRYVFVDCQAPERPRRTVEEPSETPKFSRGFVMR